MILPNRGILISLEDVILKKIVESIYGDNAEFEILTEDRQKGRYIKVVNLEEDEIHFVCLSNPGNNSRNARLMQFIPPTYMAYSKESSFTNKKIDAYIIEPTNNDKTNYAKMSYRCCATLGIKILNESELGFFDNINPFVQYEEFKECRNKTSERNSHNNQTYFIDESNDFADQISIYGKTFGANGMEAFVLAMTLSKLTDKPIVFYQVIDNNTNQISEAQRDFLRENDVVIGDVSIELEENGSVRTTDDTNTSRNTPVYHYNLLKKFGEKRCYICGCDMEHMVIGSHIERITDINHNTSYSNTEKNRRATDGDNGFWLCANHDKMFEFGIIYFDGATLKVGTLLHEETDKAYIDHSFKSLDEVYDNELTSVGAILDDHFIIRDEHYNQNMRDYLQKHKNRVTTSNIVL